MDFYRIGQKEEKNGSLTIYPDFLVRRSQDLMVQGGAFYAVWDEEAGLWSRDEYELRRLVDEDLLREKERLEKDLGVQVKARLLENSSNNGWRNFKTHLKSMSDNAKPLDMTLTFSNTDVKRTDYASRRLPYPLEEGDYSAWDELVGTLYAVDQREKIEWAIGAVISGDAKKIQKFLVFYGTAGTGKSTILNIIQMLFEGYTTTFEAKALGSANNQFATEAFKSNPLVAIQHDGDLSRIEDNSRLNSIVAHEEMTMNEKFKASYTARVNAFLFMGTNQPVKITDARSGLIRRLLDVRPTGVRLPANHYQTLMSKIEFELGAIAKHCLDVYLHLGKNHFNNYRPTDMMLQTDFFYNFIEAYYDVFKDQEYTTLTQAFNLYKEFCSENGYEKFLPKHRIREELKAYFEVFEDRKRIDGHYVHSVYSQFSISQFKIPDDNEEEAFSLVLDETTSLFDQVFADQPAQLANDAGTPKQRWANVKTTLAEIDTHEVHFVKVPENHIVIDFDLKDEDGRKNLERNLRAASTWPPTYAELSKSGGGVHLHYNYTGGDLERLRQDYSDGIEVKVYRGDTSLRRCLTRCNNVGFADIASGLPLKEKKMLTESVIKSEKGLRDLIGRNLRKEIHAGTKPSVDFIKKILDEAYESGMVYDVTDLRNKIMSFANNSSHQPLLALKTVQQMKFKSEDSGETAQVAVKAKDDRLVFFDVEVYPNLFVVCWKFEGTEPVTKMRNPTPQEVERLFDFKLIGFNNRRYDNHMLYARHLGYDNERLYQLSQKIISGSVGSMFGEAYNLSYTDIYDYSSKKQSLKKFEIELGLTHMEMDIPWDQPVPDDMIDKVEEYCVNDVLATEATHKARHADFVARQILADLSGLTVNHPTQKHTAKIIFGNDKNPQRSFVYTDLSEQFPGYKFELGKSTYMGEEIGEGGLVRAEPGIYYNVALLDVASMHPTSIEQLNLFGPYTKNYSALKEARIAIKHKDYAKARKMLDGRLAPFLEDESGAKGLADALKIALNIVYGLTSAKFDNPFKDIRNVDNIVAKRGALFMMDLKKFIEDEGFIVAHIKTDSVKIPNATPEIIEKIKEFGEKYGYEFEHEATYERMALVNDAVYVARVDGLWTATGAQFQHPYVFKTLFSKADLDWDDYCETKQVAKGAIYLDLEYDRPYPLTEAMQFVGRIGRFVPVNPSSGGGILYRVADGKHYAVAGTKGYYWLPADVALANSREVDLDLTYFENLADDAIRTINKFGSFEEFVSP